MERAHLFLAMAIVAEVIATTALKSSEGFSRWGPSLLTVAGYAVSFYGLSLSLQALPTGVVYAIWSGVGIVLISLVAWWLHGQRLDVTTLLGMGLIIAGVVVVNLGSARSSG